MVELDPHRISIHLKASVWLANRLHLASLRHKPEYIALSRMECRFLATLASYFVISNLLLSSNCIEEIQVKLGILIGSRRAQNETNYSRPGRLLIPALQYGMDKINLRPEPHEAQARIIRFIPFIAETFGSEAESIKQTIELIHSHRVNLIIGPQETCRVEARLASIYNIALVSHYCNSWPMTPTSQFSPADKSTTFVEAKPAPWHIVDRVVGLIDQLLSSSDCYPRHFVLLYSARHSTDSEELGGKRSDESNQSDTKSRRQVGDEADQYHFIGRSLERRLSELKWRLKVDKDDGSGLSDATNSTLGRQLTSVKEIDSLAILNWHSTFHYGYTSNPFRRLIRRHLFRKTYNKNLDPEACRATSGHLGASPERASNRDETGANPRSSAAIYIIVGHYYEHLGLMLALNELNLLARQSSQKSEIIVDNETGQPQSSISISTDQLDCSSSTDRSSLVIGVDIEHYDEREDSVRLLRGLLMDQGDQHHSHHHESFESIASSYGHYLGVVPAKPSGMDELQADIVAIVNHSTPSTPIDTYRVNSPEIDSAKPTVKAHKLLQLMRMPVEAFHLYRSLMHTSSYFHECLLAKNLTLDQCSDGLKISKWLRQSLGSPNDGADNFNIITRRTPSRISAGNESSDMAEDSGLVSPVARFGSRQQISFHVEPGEIDPIWLPFWCAQLTKPLNDSRICSTIHTSQSRMRPIRFVSWLYGRAIWIAILGLMTLSAICLMLWSLYSDRELKVERNSWFEREDEENAQTIIQELLVAPELSVQDTETANGFECIAKTTDTLDIHCLMFRFPSCRFVHWISGLYQLKEMMFQHQTLALEHDERRRFDISPDIGKGISSLLKGTILESFENRLWSLGRWNRPKGFWEANQHNSTVRVLMNKYKSINRTVCQLRVVNSNLIVGLRGLMLDFNRMDEGRKARLLIERVGRGELRSAMARLTETLQEPDCANIRFRVVLGLLNDCIDGLSFIHESNIKFHGRLLMTNCMVTSDWRVKLSGFQVHHLRRSLGKYSPQYAIQQNHMDEFKYSAPELLENLNDVNIMDAKGMQLADIFSISFIIYEMLVGQEPWSCLTHVKSSKLLLERLIKDISFRPPLMRLQESSNFSPFLNLSRLSTLVRSCWSHSVNLRPKSACAVREQLRSCYLDGMNESERVLDRYIRRLEDLSIENRKRWLREREMKIQLQLESIPRLVVANLRANKNHGLQQSYDSIGLCVFRFIVSCPQDKISNLLNDILSQVYKLTATYQGYVQLVESQVNSTMNFIVYTGGPVVPVGRDSLELDHHHLTASYALQLLDVANQMRLRHNNYIQLKCALHCGPIIGCLVGSPEVFEDLHSCETSSRMQRFLRFVLFGSALEVAGCLESESLPQRIQLSTEFRLRLLQRHRQSDQLTDGLVLNHHQDFVMIKREGKIRSRALGDLEAYWLLNGPRLTSSQSLLLSPSGTESNSIKSNEPSLI